MEKYEKLMKVAVGALCAIAVLLGLICVQLAEIRSASSQATSLFGIEYELKQISKSLATTTPSRTPSVNLSEVSRELSNIEHTLSSINKSLSSIAISQTFR